MERGTSYYAGVGAGILCGVLLIAVIVFMTKKKGRLCGFDERQIAARGKSFQYGFFTYLVYFAGFGVLQEVTKERFIDNFTGIFIGICMATLVFAANAIWNDAYLSLRENAKTYILIFTSVGALNLLFGVKNVIHHDGGGEYMTNLAVGILVLLLALILVMKDHKEKKQEEEEM